MAAELRLPRFSSCRRVSFEINRNSSGPPPPPLLAVTNITNTNGGSVHDGNNIADPAPRPSYYRRHLTTLAFSVNNMSSSAKFAQHRVASSFCVYSRSHCRASSQDEEEYEDLPPSRAYQRHDIEEPPISSSTLGRYLARRLVEVGVTDVFSVPGDFNLLLLDHLLAEPGLNLVGCCNELNAGYAADGYARSRGVGGCAVTFTVGGLSVINAIAGAYSDNLPVICIVGGPNYAESYAERRIPIDNEHN